MATKTVTLEFDRSTRRARKAATAFNEGFALQKKRDWPAAIACYDRALQIDRTLFGAWANRGMCHHMLCRPEDALRDYARAWMVGTPELQQMIRVNRGVIYGSIRRYGEALADFATDQSWESQLNAAYIEMLCGDLGRGLALYRNRPTVRQWKAPLHRLRDLAGKDVLILHEQGFGDSIMMARFVPQIAAVAKSVHWTTRTALLPLFSRNFPTVEFSDGGDVKAAALIYQHDAFVLVMDMWQTCGLGIDGRPYLSIDRQIVEEMRFNLPDGPKIGLQWRGRPEFSNDHNRSMYYAWLRAYFVITFGDDVKFVSLQKDLRDGEIGPEVIDGGALIKDFADTAALMSCLDAVISVDTATAHLAGALGIPTAVLLPYAPDWRWGPDGDIAPWYDSVRLFRQPAFGAWEPAVTAAAQWVRCGM